MIAAPAYVASPPWSEADRLEALRSYGILDTPPEPAFDEITRVASLVCKAPISVVNLIEDDRQFFKSEIGLGVRETPVDVSICAHAILQRDLFVVPDTTKDSRFACNPLVTGEPNLRFYAGALLETPDGLPLGTVCVLDYSPRPEGITTEQAEVLRALARAAMAQIELRRSNRILHQNQEHTRLALDAGNVGTWVWNIPNGTIVGDERLARMFGIASDEAARGAPVEQFAASVHPDDRERIDAVLSQVIEQGGEHEVEHRIIQQGQVRWIVARGRCELDAQGRPLRFPAATIDITELKQATETRELLARELSHRIKNIFAVVSGLAALSARGYPEAASFARSFRERISALAQAHEYVMPQGPETHPQSANESVMGLMRALLEPYLHDGCDRVSLSGDDVPIGSTGASALALIMHEQATNAVKYGALSNDVGRVLLEGERNGDSYRLTWTEVGGPLVQGPPQRQGFGTVLAAKSVAGQLGGEIEHVWVPEGLTVRLTLAMERLAR
ncbi:MAG TPA: HWE histidine kinase domain-containing protein [Microvirga sp.]